MKNSKKIWLNLVASIALITVFVGMSACSKHDQTEANMLDATVGEGVTETPALVFVETLNYELAFDAQLAEMVFYREIPDTAEDDLEFYTKINNQEYAIFTLVFNAAEGDIVQMIDDAQGNKIPVAFMMNTLPNGITEEAANNFYIAQGAVNEVVASIKVS